MITAQDFDQLYRVTLDALDAAKAGRRDEGERILREALVHLYQEQPEATELIERWEATLAGYREQFPTERRGPATGRSPETSSRSLCSASRS